MLNNVVVNGNSFISKKQVLIFYNLSKCVGWPHLLKRVLDHSSD